MTGAGKYYVLNALKIYMPFGTKMFLKEIYLEGKITK